jgi:hypothetical protein
MRSLLATKTFYLQSETFKIFPLIEICPVIAIPFLTSLFIAKLDLILPKEIRAVTMVTESLGPSFF